MIGGGAVFNCGAGAVWAGLAGGGATASGAAKVDADPGGAGGGRCVVTGLAGKLRSIAGGAASVGARSTPPGWLLVCATAPSGARIIVVNARTTGFMEVMLP